MRDTLHAISDDKAQLMSVTEFNYYPNRYIHPDWVARLENSQVIKKLLNNARSEDNLAGYLLDRFELKDKLWFEFDSPLRRLLLQPRSDILRVVMFAGAVLNSEHASKAIHNKDVVRMRRGFGDVLFDFALKEVPFLFDLTYLPRLAAPAPDTDIQAHLAASGLWCLGKALQGEPEALVERLYLKMSAAEYPFLESQPATFHKQPCTSVINTVIETKLASMDC